MHSEIRDISVSSPPGIESTEKRKRKFQASFDKLATAARDALLDTLGIDVSISAPERLVAGEKVRRLETTVEELSPQLNRKFEQEYYKTYGFSVHVPESTLELLGIDYFTGSLQQLRQVCSDTRIIKVVNIHGWNGSHKIWEMKTAHENWTDGQIRRLREQGKHVVVINIDSNGWGKSCLSEDGLRVQREGYAADFAVRPAITLKHKLTDIDAAIVAEQTKLQSLLASLPESSHVNFTHTLRALQSERQQILDKLALYEEDLKAFSNDDFEVTHILDKITDTKKQINQTETRIAFLQSKYVAGSEIESERKKAFHLRANLYKYRAELDTIRNTPKKSKLDSFGRIGEQKYDRHKRNSMPGSVHHAVNATEILLDEVLQIRGILNVNGHSQGGKIVDEYTARKSQQRKVIHDSEEFFANPDEYEPFVYGENLVLIPVTLAAAEAGGQMADDLPLVKLLDNLRTPAGLLLLRLGDAFRGSNTLVGALLAMQLAMKGMPWKTMMELSFYHGIQVNSQNLLNLLLQAAEWTHQNLEVDPQPNVKHFAGKQDSLIPLNHFVKWLKSFFNHAKGKPQVPHAFNSVVNPTTVTLLEGDHYFHVLQDNQDAILDWISDAVSDVSSSEIISAVTEFLEPNEEQEQIKNVVRFCVSSDPIVETKSIRERLQFAEDQARVFLKNKYAMCPVVPVSLSELIVIETQIKVQKQVDYVKYAKNFAKNAFFDALFDERLESLLHEKVYKLREKFYQDILLPRSNDGTAVWLRGFKTTPSNWEEKIFEMTDSFPFISYVIAEIGSGIQKRKLRALIQTKKILTQKMVESAGNSEEPWIRTRLAENEVELNDLVKVILQRAVSTCMADFEAWLRPYTSQEAKLPVDSYPIGFEMAQASIVPGYTEAILEETQRYVSKKFARFLDDIELFDTVSNLFDVHNAINPSVFNVE